MSLLWRIERLMLRLYRNAKVFLLVGLDGVLKPSDCFTPSFSLYIISILNFCYFVALLLLYRSSTVIELL